MIKQTSASKRCTEARSASAQIDAWLDGFPADALAPEVIRAANALRALITPPGVGEDVPTIAHNIVKTYGGRVDPDLLLQIAVRAGIQSAHETWEPVDVPSQEFMLRHLGLDYHEHGDRLVVHAKYIEREI